MNPLERIRLPVALAVLLGAALLPAPLPADVLVLKDGKRVEGDVQEEGDTYKVVTKYGTLNVQKDMVTRVVKVEALLNEARSFRVGGSTLLEEAQKPGVTAAERKAKLASAGETLKKALALFKEARSFSSATETGLDNVIAAVEREIAGCQEGPDELAPVAPPKAPGATPAVTARTPAVPPEGPLVAPTARPAGPATLLAHWKLDEGVGTTAKDVSGNGRHGTLTGGVEWTTVGRRHGVRLDGKSGCIDTGAPLPALSGPFSFAFWINPGDTQRTYAQPLGNHHRLESGGTIGASFEQSASTTNTFYLVLGTSDGWVTSRTIQLAAGVWQHVAAVADGRQAVLYVDGVEKVRSPMRAVPVANRADAFKLGTGVFPNRFFNGLLGDVRVYAGALTASEVEELARAPADASPVARLPLPAGPALADAEKEIRSLFKEEYAKRAVADRSVLARKLIQAGAGTKGDDALRFVSFREARDLAAAAGDFATACAAIDRLDALFDVDGPAMKAAAFAAVVRAVDVEEEGEAVFAKGLELAERLAREDAFETALKLTTPLEDLARRRKSAEDLKTAQGLAKDLRARQADWNRVRPSLEKLKASPDDAEACLAVGRYYAAADRWTEALSLLAKAGAPALQAAAAKELSKPVDAAALAETGDLWMAAADKESAALKPALQDRARGFYEKALHGLSGLAKARVEKRLEEMAKAAAQRLSIPASCVLFLDFEGAVPAKHDGQDVLQLRDLSGAGTSAVLEGGRLGVGFRGGKAAVMEGAAAIRFAKPLPVGDAWTIAYHMNMEGPWAAQRCMTTVAAWHHHILIRPGGILASCADTSEISLSEADLSTLKGWHHVAAVGRGGVTVFYIDGKEAGRTKSQEKGAIVLIGNYLSGDYPAVNPLDNVTVFRAALTPDMIAALARR
jgi:hypothetical protein